MNITKKQMIKQFQPILDVTNDGIDFKWFSHNELNALPTDENGLISINGEPHYVWTLRHSDDGSCDFISNSFARVNSLGQYILSKINPRVNTTDYYEISSGVYRILKSIK